MQGRKVVALQAIRPESRWSHYCVPTAELVVHRLHAFSSAKGLQMTLLTGFAARLKAE
jgi:hypothetical protein